MFVLESSVVGCINIAKSRDSPAHSTSAWRHFRLTPVLCRLHCPRVYSMRRPAATNRKGWKGKGRWKEKRGECCYYYRLLACKQTRFLETMNCSRRRHCPILADSVAICLANRKFSFDLRFISVLRARRSIARGDNLLITTGRHSSRL